MAEIVKTGVPTMATTGVQPANRNTGLYAGEDLGWMDVCYIKAADGKVWRSTGAAVAAAAKVRGWSATNAKTGDPVTLLHDVDVGYGTTLVPGADYFVSGTVPGGIADVASVGGTGAIAFAKDAQRIRILRSTY